MSLTESQLQAITHCWLDMRASLAAARFARTSASERADAEVLAVNEAILKELEEAFPHLLDGEIS